MAWEAVRSDELGSAEKAGLLADFDRVLGLDFGAAAASTEMPDRRILERIRERKAARAEGDWARADAIRDELLGKGIVLEDSPEGTRWHRA